jgi:zinc protease
MMFKGTKRFKKGEIDNLTAKFGGFNNGFTSYDFTAFCFSFASDRWWSALEIESERMANNLFNPDEFELERQVILEELRMELDDPWESLRDAVSRRVFPGHPYRFPVAGLIGDVEHLELDRLVEFYHSRYVPENAVITVVGDIDRDRVCEEVEKRFGGFTNGSLQVEPEFEGPVYGPAMRLEVERPSPITRVSLALPAPAFNPKEFIALEVLDQILIGGKLSRLQRRLIEDYQYATMINSEYAESRDPYLYNLRLELNDGIEVEKIEDVIFEELNKLSSEGVSRAELERACTRAVVQFVSDIETTLDLAFQIGILEILDNISLVNEYSSLLERVTPNDISQFISQYFTRETTTTAFLRQKHGCCKP